MLHISEFLDLQDCTTRSLKTWKHSIKMASDKPSTGIIPFAKATEIKRIDANTYQANLVDSFCIGAGKHHLHTICMYNENMHH